MAAQTDPNNFLAGHLSALGLVARVLMPVKLRRHLDSSDLVQQTLEEALRDRTKLEAMPEPERFTYLRRCLNHNLIDAVHKFKAVGEVQNSSVRLESWLSDQGSLPGDRLLREERFRHLADALALLPENQRTAVELKHLQGLSARDIAVQMGCTETAVGGLLRRGMRELRDKLGATSGASNASP